MSPSVDIPESQAPVAQNSTHQVVPVTEIEEKDEAKVDPLTNQVKIEKVRIPVVKNKVVKKPKAAPVAQNSTHEVVPEVEEEEQEVTKTSKITGETTKTIVKVPVVKNVVKPKEGVIEDKDLDEEDKKKKDYLDDLENNLKEAFSKIHKQKATLKIKAAEAKKGTKLSNDEKDKETSDAADEAQKAVE